MAKRMMKRVKTKTARMSKATVKVINDQYYGAEPSTIVTDTAGLTAALNWYNYMYDNDKARDFLLDFMKKNEFLKSEINAVKRVPKYNVPSTLGWLARIQMNGNVLLKPDYFNTRLSEIITAGAEIKEEAPLEKEKAVISIQERMLVKNNMLFSDAEVEVIDARASMYNFLISNEITPAAATFFLSKYQPIYDEIMSNDEQVLETWGKNIKSERAFWQSIIDDLERYLNNKKAVKTRKPRAKKTKSAVSTISKLQYQKDFPALKIVSVNPTEIVGSSQVWTYNTKYKKLAVYNAQGPAGISVKGTTLIGFDPETSAMKGTRKPEEVTERVLSAGKIQLRRIMPELKTKETVPTGRINSDTVILRVTK